MPRTTPTPPSVRSLAGALVLSIAAVACGTGRPAAGDTAMGRDTAPAAAAGKAARPAPDTATLAPDGRWLARPDGVGPLRVGMTANEALAAAGAGGKDTNPDTACHFLDVAKMPKRLYVMVESGVVTRIDVRDTSVATAEGAHLLSPQDSVLALYAGRVQVQPHKYTRGWSYLVVTPPGDSLHRIVFEADGSRVTTFRVGREPSVEYVEGCS